jgi:hypothetical protein
MSTVFPVTTMITWRADGGVGLEGVRLLLGNGAFRALGRLVRTGTSGGFTASYRLVVGEDATLERLSITSATTERERHLTINRTEDGFWLLDTGSGGTRADFDGAVDVDVEHSPMFNTLPIRRLGLHRSPGDRTLPVVHVTLPELEVRLVEQRYLTVATLGEGDAAEAVVGFRTGDFHADIVVDADGVVASYPGIASRVAATGAAPASA